MTFATRSFGKRVAPFDDVDLHDLRDFATYYLALGIALVVAPRGLTGAFRSSRSRPSSTPSTRSITPSTSTTRTPTGSAGRPGSGRCRRGSLRLARLAYRAASDEAAARRKNLALACEHRC
jgi:hypothetical protein